MGLELNSLFSLVGSMSQRGRPRASKTLLLAAANDPKQLRLRPALQLRLASPKAATRVAVPTDSIAECIVLDDEQSSDEDCVILNERATERVATRNSPPPNKPVTIHNDADLHTHSLATNSFQLKAKRAVYTSKQQVQIKAVLEQYHNNISATVKLLKTQSGYEHMDRRTVRRFITAKACNRRGPRVDSHFEAQVFNSLIQFTYESCRIDSREKAVSFVSVAFSRDIIKKAAAKVASLAPWLDNPKIRQIKFSDGWVSKFLSRQCLSRRRVTATWKPAKPTEIANCMREIQKVCAHFFQVLTFICMSFFHNDHLLAWFACAHNFPDLSCLFR
jgi:hypothetical protein